MKYIGLFLITLFLLSSCEECTDELKCVTVKLEGIAPTATYTIRASDSDTVSIWTSSDTTAVDLGSVTVLCDKYWLGANPEEFRFVGVRRGLVLFNLPFLFRNDGCHIQKVSGPNVIDG